MDYRDTTVIIPVKNEPAAGKVAKEVLAALEGCKVIVIHNGERKEDTMFKSDYLIKSDRITILERGFSGKGRACVDAAKHVKTPIMCFIDGDDTYEVGALKGLVQEVRDGADMALGDRFAYVDSKSMPAYIQFGNRVLTLVGNLVYGLSIKDSQTGLRAMTKEFFDGLHIREPGFGFEIEMNVKAAKGRFKVVELPIRYYERAGRTKQFKPLNGFRLLFITLKYALLP